MTRLASSAQSAKPAALVKLRELTSAHHQRLEDALQLGQPAMTLHKYTRLLRRFHALYRVLESDAGLGAWATQLDELGLTWQARRKLPCLEQDLAALHLPSLNLAGPDFGGIELASVPAVLGRLYVLEGSTLGGQLISRNVQAHLGLTPKTGLAFFTGYAERTGAMWRQMRRVLAQRLQADEDIACAVGEAQATFILFYQWLVL